MHAVLMTPPGSGAIAVYLLAGGDLPRVLSQFCQGKAASAQPGAIQRVTIRDGQNTIDDALLVCLAADVFELHVHGGVAVVQAVAALLQQHGVTVLDAQSDAGRALAARGCADEAYRQGIGAEILGALPLAKTTTALKLLSAQTTHGLTAWRDHWRAALAEQKATLWQFHSDAQWVLDRAAALRFLLIPPRIAIVGPPNAGKSTLANALLGRPVSITSAIPGTTRDWVDATGVLAHGSIAVPAIFVDTAGIRETPDPIEIESIRRSKTVLSQADAVIVVLDGSTPEPSTNSLFLQHLAEDALPPTLVAVNKSDLAIHGPPTVQLPHIHISALTHAGIPDLMTALLEHLSLGEINPHEPFAFTSRQQHILNTASLAPSIPQAISALVAL